MGDSHDQTTENALFDLQDKSTEEIRTILEELYSEERSISYQRRVLHGKIDILRSELVRRLDSRHRTGEDVITGSDVDRLIDILARDLRGALRHDIGARDLDTDL